jgi:hypothetical protein
LPPLLRPSKTTEQTTENVAVKNYFDERKEMGLSLWAFSFSLKENTEKKRLYAIYIVILYVYRLIHI